MFRRKLRDDKRQIAPDLQTQLEDLLDTVWRSESRADQHDRIDAQARFDALRANAGSARRRKR
jgi:hypothetical protein